MILIERFLAAKTGVDEESEDVIGISDNFAVVADGVSTKGASLCAGSVSSGRLAAKAIADVVCALPRDASLEMAIAKMNDVILQLRSNTGSDCAACAIVLSAHKRQIWSVGDCQFLAGETWHHPKSVIDELLASLRSFVLTAKIKSGETVDDMMKLDPGRAAILPFLRMQSQFANISGECPFAYSVINGNEIPEGAVKVFDIPVHIEEVILASDGYPVLMPTLAESEAVLADLIIKDPLCFTENRSTKGLMMGASSYDDRAYLRVRLNVD